MSTLPRSKCMIVRWKKFGAYIKDGIAFARVPGDEDVMELHEAKRYVLVGNVVVIEEHANERYSIDDGEELSASEP